MKNIIRATFAILVSCALPLAAGAQTAREYFMLGNSAYKSGDYERAVKNYESALENGFASAELHYNLANSFAKLNRKGEALLNYKRAVYHAPRMREASANLEMFSKDNSLESGLDKFKTPLAAELSDSEWTLLAFASFWAAVLLIFIPPLFGKRTVATVFLAIVCISLLTVAVLSLRDWISYSQTAVAIKPDVPLRVSPTKTAPVSSIAAEGQCADIKREYGEFVYVETRTGKRGWTSKSDFVPIVE